MSSASPQSVPSSSGGTPRTVECPQCGQVHERVELRPREVSRCARCDTQLGKGRASNWIVTLAWVLTGLILAVPANFLPIVKVAQLGNEHHSRLASGALALWQQDMPLVAVLVVGCGIIAPLLLLGSLAAMLIPLWLRRPSALLHPLARWLHFLEQWSMPEVHLLAVLVAFIKLGDVVEATPGPGLWCYTAMSISLLIAWRRVDIDAAAEALLQLPSSAQST